MGRLKICLVAPPFSGHLHPVLAIGRELSGIADVTVVSTPGAAATAAAAGLAFRPVLADHEATVWQIASPGVAVKNHPLLLYRQFKANVSLQHEALAEFSAMFAQLQPDLVIADFTLPVAGVAAERQGAKWWSVLPSPCVFETPDGPPAYSGGLMPADSWPERTVHGMLRKFIRFFKRGIFFLFRKTLRLAGLLSVYREDGSERAYSSEAILATGFPELEFSRCYPGHFHFIGAALFTPPVEAKPPEFVMGKKHVLVTLGTHLSHHKERLATKVRQIANARPDLIFHFSDGELGGTESGITGNFHRYSFISYADHLARYALVIHHGGSGVMLHCLRHGIPAVVLPLDFDQFDNAARLVVAGVALRVAKENELEKAIATAMEDEDFRARCRSFAFVTDGRHMGEIVRALVAGKFGHPSR